MNLNDLDYAERLVIGSCLVDRHVIADLIELLPSEDIFLSQSSRCAWKAIRQLYDKGAGVDAMTLQNQVQKNKDEKITTPLYIAQVSGIVGSTAHVEDHALILKQEFIRRELERQGFELARSSKSDENDSLELLANHMNSLNELSTLTSQRQEKRLDAIVATLVSKRTQDKGVPFLSFVGLLKHLSGGDLIILAARPSIGKTAFALQVARNIAYEGYPVGVLSLEMAEEQLVARMLVNDTGIDFERVLNNEIHPNEGEQYRAAYKDLSELPIWIDDEAGISNLQARAKASRMINKHGIKVLFVDYLQLMHSKAGSREQEISIISRTLKQIAKTNNIPVIALSQLSRKVEDRSDKRPMLSDLRDSGAIEQDADIVMFLHRPEYYGVTQTDRHNDTSGLCELIIAKNRNGKLGTADMRFNGERFTFEKWDNFTKLHDINPAF